MALLIYGMVLFPNPDQLIDVNTVKIFISSNPVPTLLGDLLHSFHTRTMRKRGVLMCCTPLLARWFISHLPQSVLKNEQGSRWSHRLMTLKHSDIHWCSRSIDNVTIVDRCGEFPNVLLLGIRGCITYNLSWLCDSLGIPEDMVRMICSSKEWCSIIRATIKDAVRGLCDLGGW